MNPFEMMKNLGNLQTQVQDMQEKLKTISATGSSGGGMVTITINGHFEILSMHIEKEAVNPEDVKMLEDLVFAAFSQAITNLKDKMKNEATGFMGPGLMGF